MIIIIPCSKESTRFAGKNALLIPYTVSYLDKVQTMRKDPLQVFVAMTAETQHLKSKFISKNVNFQFLNLPDEVKNQHMRTLIQMALDVINPATNEPIVLLQLTQPLRALNLIDKALQVYNECQNRAVMSYILGPEAWRVLNQDGNYNADLRPTGQRLRVHDGSIYIFNRDTYPALWSNAPKSSVQNEVPELIDIDYKDQFDPNKLNQLCKFYI